MKGNRSFESKRQAAIKAGVDISTIDLWVKLGLLPSVPINQKGWYKIPAAALERFINEGAAAQPASTEHAA